MNQTTATPSRLRTKERLLHAACAVFSRHGFALATVAEICEAAQCNIASVNYHFGSKERLYQETLTFLASRLEGQHPFAPQADESPAAALRRYIQVSVNRVFAEGEGNLHALVIKELSEPTPIGQAVLFPLMQQRRAQLQGLLAALAPQAGETVLEGVQFAIVSQLALLAQVGDQLMRWAQPGGDLASWTRLKAHQISEIALAGLARLQEAP